MKNKKSNKISKMQHSLKTKKVVFSILISLIVLVLLSISAIFITIYFSPTKIDTSKINKGNKNLTILDNDSNIIFSIDNSSNITFDQLNSYTINAFVAVEDKRFYNHHGLDYTRIASAAIKNISQKKIVQGASTITQQIIKNTHLNSQKSYKRKLNEAQLAIKLEKMYSKDQILEIYLNMLYFGSGEYGIHNASNRFFGKAPNELSLMESCILASIPKSPTKYNPINNYDNSIKRAKLVLGLMLEQQLIDNNSYELALKEEIVITNSLNENNKPNIYNKNVINEALKLLNIPNNDLLNGNIIIKTFYDSQIQNNLVKSFDGNSDFNQVGLYVDNATRGISALHCNFDIDIFNYRRQPGSIIKPLVCYAPALDSGNYQPITKINDIKTTFGYYSPSNYKDIYMGNITLTQALIHSQNIPAITLYNALGSDYCNSFLEKMDFQLDKNDKNLAMALGGMTYGTTMLEICNGYSTLANNGDFVQSSFIKEIVTADGKVLYNNENRVKKTIYTPQSAYLTNNMLVDCVKYGTAKKLSDLDYTIASKTGTVSNSDKNFNNDIYNISYTKDNTLLVWYGSRPDSLLPYNYTGGGITSVVSANFYESYNNFAPNDFEQVDGIEKIKIDKYAYDNLDKIMIASDNCPKNAYFECDINVKNTNMIKDTTFDMLGIDDLSVEDNGDMIYVNFVANPRLNYEILRKNFLEDEIVIQTVRNSNNKYSFTLPKSNDIFPAKYTIIAYYLDDNNNKVISMPYKISGNQYNYFNIW